jgi:hypothetical protein
MPNFPDIRVDIDLSGDEGGQYLIIARVLSALRKNKVEEIKVQHFRNQLAACSDYTAILAVVGQWVNFNDGQYENCQKWIK